MNKLTKEEQEFERKIAIREIEEGMLASGELFCCDECGRIQPEEERHHFFRPTRGGPGSPEEYVQTDTCIACVEGGRRHD